jgi:hypothetical protein
MEISPSLEAAFDTLNHLVTMQGAMVLAELCKEVEVLLDQSELFHVVQQRQEVDACLDVMLVLVSSDED